MMNSTTIGNRGEDLVANYLISHGYEILERNYNCKVAEIDIIAYNKDRILCFVEVKTRRNKDFGFASDAVDYRKRDKIKTGAIIYLRRIRKDVDIRFDVAEVYGDLTRKEPVFEINYIENAF